MNKNMLIACVAVTSGLYGFLYAEEAQQSTVKTQKTTEQQIENLYADISGFIIDSDETKMINTKGGAATYGEITYEALKTVLDDLGLTKDDVFYDLGCGVGKTCVQVALDTPAKAVGIELSPTRVKHAQNVQKKLVATKKVMPAQRLQFQEKNIFDVTMGDATVVFMCSTCFSHKLMQDITDKLARLSKPNLKVISLKPMPEHKDFELIKTYQLPMTWSSQTPVHVYQRKKQMVVASNSKPAPVMVSEN